MGRKLSAGLVEKPQLVTRRFDLKRKTASAADELKERLAREAPELTFDFDAVVDEALAEKVAEANRELDARAARADQ